jgi:hypothetical protein
MLCGFLLDNTKWLICRNLWMYWKRSTSLSSRELGQLLSTFGCDFFCNDGGVLCMAPKKYIEKMMMGYDQMFGERPLANAHLPLEKGDHPELDTSELLDQTGVQ